MSRIQTLRLALPLLLAGHATSAYAVDGVVLIDQNRALAGNVTPGDTPGFPVSITQPGSYKLSGNLTVPNSSTSGIVISASNVTIDLGGFAILGPVVCPGAGCTGFLDGPGGITVAVANSGLVPQYNITIRNGTIQGIGGSGIQLAGGGVRVEQIHARGNAVAGIRVVNSTSAAGTCIVRQNTVENNGFQGISIGGSTVNALVVENAARNNSSSGIVLDNGRAVNNLSVANGQVGLYILSAGSYTGNYLADNTLGNVLGGVNMGQNLCGAALCPGAAY
jgi:parallel beta helix pectate lyase-like protein